MPVIDQKLCQNRLRKAKRPGDTNPLLGSQFKLHDSFICAGGYINQDTCTGDGGSPLVCARKGNGGKDKRYVQVESTLQIQFYIIYLRSIITAEWV